MKCMVNIRAVIVTKLFRSLVHRVARRPLLSLIVLLARDTSLSYAAVE
jgi:hypothetical protein